MENAIEVKGLCKRYKEFELRDVSFSLESGSVMGLIGENGAGKTTTIRLLLNIIKRDAGSVRLLGLDNIENERAAKEQVGVVMDTGKFFEDFTAKDMGSVMRGVYSGWDGAYYAALLKKLDISPKLRLKSYSKGMTAKLSIAAAMAHHPRLLIMDEATSGLDPVVRSEILDMFYDFIQSEGNSVLFSTHITSDLERIADYITFIHKGGVVLSKPLEDVKARFGVLRCGAADMDRVDKRFITGSRRTAFGADALIDGRAEFARAYPDMALDNAALEDIMLYYIKGEKLK